jgi:hypothetical protein
LAVGTTGSGKNKFFFQKDGILPKIIRYLNLYSNKEKITE